jgi:2-amino-4-hydroxy-6-hydroxymethyldihydropteridine diphosphokinase
MIETVERAAAGELPSWAEVKPKRKAHIERVALLVAEWALARPVDEAERKRWLAAAWLHDAFRDAQPETLRPLLSDEFADWPGPLLHGPASAAKLRGEGETDEPLLRAIAYHTVGHSEFDAAGRALYLADFLEPGRTFDPVGRAVLRARMPQDENSVLREVLRNRMAHLITSHKKIRRETVAFWNSTAS